MGEPSAPTDPSPGTSAAAEGPAYCSLQGSAIPLNLPVLARFEAGAAFCGLVAGRRRGDPCGETVTMIRPVGSWPCSGGTFTSRRRATRCAYASVRCDVVVEPEHVGGVVPPFDRTQPVEIAVERVPDYLLVVLVQARKVQVLPACGERLKARNTSRAPRRRRPRRRRRSPSSPRYR
jgi:hypothetical protein